jgi:ankyrin repeat protein
MLELEFCSQLKMTPLHWAVERQFIKVVELLLRNGADPHAISKFHKTPYSLAQAHNNVEILKLLSIATQLHESNLKQVFMINRCIFRIILLFAILIFNNLLLFLHRPKKRQTI